MFVTFFFFLDLCDKEEGKLKYTFPESDSNVHIWFIMVQKEEIRGCEVRFCLCCVFLWQVWPQPLELTRHLSVLLTLLTGVEQ